MRKGPVGRNLSGPIPLRFKGGEAAQRPGWLVKGREATLYAREAHIILFEVTNHPVCAAEERDLFINGAATPPLKGGNGPVSFRRSHPAPLRRHKHLAVNELSSPIDDAQLPAAGFHLE